MKVVLAFEEIAQRIRAVKLPDVDCVVGVATGGSVPAALVAFHLDKPLYTLGINYRARDNSPRFDAPKVLFSAEIPPQSNHILLVDDVSVSGKTLEVAKTQLPNAKVTTLVMKGSADYVLFPEVAECVIWPWKAEG